MHSAVERIARLLHFSGERRTLSGDSDRLAIDRASAEVLARVAHEMRQPLSAALAAFRVLGSAADEPARTRARAVLDRQLQRMARLIDDLSESARTRLSRPTLALERLDLRRVLQDVADAVGPQVREKHHRLAIEIPPAPVWILGDDQRLQQVFSNLFLNAVKHTAAGGLLGVELTCRGAQAVLSVTDTGHGIHPSALPHIFKPFIQGSGTGGEGMGIGLAVAQQLVELHHGTIRAISAGPDRGSRFVVTLPLAAGGPPAVLHH